MFHPIYFFKGIKVSDYNHISYTSVEYELNDLIGIVTVFRVYHILRVYFIMSDERNIRSQRVCNMNTCNANWLYAIKCKMQDKPLLLILIFMVTSVFICSFALHILEGPFDQSINEFTPRDYVNAVWCTLITMTTVGYGDYFPISHWGRLFGLTVCILGFIYVALLVVAITNMLVFTPVEEQSHLLLTRLGQKDKVEKTADKVIMLFVRYWVLKYQGRSPLEINLALSRARSMLWKFQNARLTLKSLYI